MIQGGADNHISRKDILRMSFLNLASWIPEYGRRVKTYVNRVLKEHPSVMILQGLDPDDYTINGLLDGLGGSLHMGDYVRPHWEHGGGRTVNAIWVRDGVSVTDSKQLELTAITEGQRVVLAPNAVLVTIKVKDTVFDIYDAESVPGVYNEELRRYVARIISRDAYARKTRTRHHFDSTMVLAGNLHATPDASSIRYLKGLETIWKATPSAWRDVWDELNGDRDNDRGIMQRVDVAAKYSKDLVLPAFRNPRRTTYFMVYDDAFGRKGTPVRIDRNGTGSGLRDGTPLSDSYGIDVDFYCPQ